MRRAAALAWATSVCVFATAAPASAADPARPSLVRVYVAGPPAAVMRMRATLQELLARIGLEAVVEPAEDDAVLAGSAPDAVARAFLDFRSLAAPRVVLAPRAAGQDVERRTLPGSTSLEVSVEEAAHVVYTAVASSLGAGEETASGVVASAAPATSEGPPPTAPAPASGPGATPTPPAPATPTPETANAPLVTALDTGSMAPRAGRPGAAQHVEAGISAFAGIASFATDSVLPGVGGSLDAALGTAPVRAAAMLSFGAFFPGDVSHGSQSSSLHAEAARLVAMAEWIPWARLGLSCGGGGGVDHVTFEPGAQTASVVPAGVASRFDPVLEAVVAARFRVSPAFGAFLLAAADVDLTPHRYVTDVNGENAPYFTLPRVRPVALIGLTYVFHPALARTPKEAKR